MALLRACAGQTADTGSTRLLRVSANKRIFLLIKKKMTGFTTKAKRKED